MRQGQKGKSKNGGESFDPIRADLLMLLLLLVAFEIAHRRGLLDPALFKLRTAAATTGARARAWVPRQPKKRREKRTVAAATPAEPAPEPIADETDTAAAQEDAFELAKRRARRKPRGR